MVARSLALDLAPRGIAVSAILPGYVPTPHDRAVPGETRRTRRDPRGDPVGPARHSPRRSPALVAYLASARGRVHDGCARHDRWRQECLTARCASCAGRRSESERDAHARCSRARRAGSSTRELREGVLEIIEDVRAHGDEAIVRAMAKYDGVRGRRRRAARRRGGGRARSGEALSPRSCGRSARASSTSRRYNEHLVLEGADWRMEIEPGLMLGEKTTADRERRAVRPERQGLVPLGARADRHAGDRRGRAGDRGRRCRRVPGTAGQVDPAVLVVADELGSAQRLPRQRAGRASPRWLVRHRDDPAGAEGARPGQPAGAGGADRGAALRHRRIHDAARPVREPRDRRRQRRRAAARRRPAERGRARAWTRRRCSSPPTRSCSPRVQRRARRAARRAARAAARVRAERARRGGRRRARPRSRRGRRRGEPVRPRAPAARDAADDEAVLAQLDHAGEILLGQWTPFSAANYTLGVPASLPTGRFARVSSGITGARVREDGIDRPRVRSGLRETSPRACSPSRSTRDSRRTPQRCACASAASDHEQGERDTLTRKITLAPGRRAVRSWSPPAAAARGAAAAEQCRRTAIPAKPEAGTFQMGIEPWLGYGPWHIAEEKGCSRNRAWTSKITNFATDDQINAAAFAGGKTRRHQHRDAHRAAASAAAGLPVKIVSCSRTRATTADAILGEGADHLDQRPEGQEGRLRGGHDQRHPAPLRARTERHEDLRHQDRRRCPPPTPASRRWPARSTRPSPTSRT